MNTQLTQVEAVAPWSASTKLTPKTEPIRNPVSAIVVNYNAGHWILNNIRSLLNEVSEIIIFDNKSTDGSIQLIRDEFAEFVGSGFIRIIESPKNIGFGPACNRCLSLASAPTVLIINPDCVAHEGAVSTLYDEWKKSGAYHLVGGNVRNADGSPQDGARRNFPSLLQAFRKLFFNESLLIHNERLPGELSFVPQIFDTQAISGACMFGSKDYLQGLGGFDEKYFLHCEDLDLCMQIKLKKGKLGFVNNAYFTHEKGVCSNSRPVWVEWQKHKGIARFYRKYCGSFYSYWGLPFVYAGIVAHMGLIIAKSAAKRKA